MTVTGPPTFKTTGWKIGPGGVTALASGTAPTEGFTSTTPDGLIITEGFRGVRVRVAGQTNGENHHEGR